MRIIGGEYPGCDRDLPVYGLPDGRETNNEDYADTVWAMYTRHCVECPYKVPERSMQFKKV